MGRRTDDAKRHKAEADEGRLSEKWGRIRTAAAVPGPKMSGVQGDTEPAAQQSKVATGPFDENATLSGIEITNLAGPDNSIWEYAETKLGSRANKFKLSELALALEYLARVTGDPAFHTAQLALGGYGFDAPGIKASAKRFLNRRGQRSEDVALRMMDPAPGSVANAALEVSAAYGVAGTNLKNAADKVRKAYAQAKRAPVVPPNDENLGSTGNWLRIRLLTGAEVSPARVEWFGASFGHDGWAVVPDNRKWRCLISQGVVAHCGFAPAPSSVGNT